MGELVLQNGACWNEYTCSNAAMRGHLELLKWARANGAPWGWRTCFALVEANDHKQVLIEPIFLCH